MITADQICLLELVAQQAERTGPGVYLVGGMVRDLFLKSDLPGVDFDFLVEGPAKILAAACNEKLSGRLTEFPNFLTCRISDSALFPKLKNIDFATARSEVYESPGHLPVVRPAASVRDDLRRRDFSVNAMAIEITVLLNWFATARQDSAELESLILDPFSGLDDIGTKLIRVLHPGSFIDDPTRIFRACRYAARIQGEIEEDTSGLLQEALRGGALGTISATRILNELRRICCEERPAEALLKLCEFGVLRHAALASADDRLARALQQMSLLPALKESALTFDLVMALCFFCLAEGERSNMIVRYSLGKKREGIYQRSHQAALDAEARISPALSNLALLVRFCLEEDGVSRRAACDEAFRRGLFGRERPA